MKTTQWQPPYQSIKVTQVSHWLGKPVVWPSPVSLTEPGALNRCIAVLCPVYDIMIRRTQFPGDLHIFVDDFGGGFRTR